MIFSSVAFLFYFLPVALILYYGLFFSNPLKNGILLILSLIFYAWGGTEICIIDDIINSSKLFSSLNYRYY